MTTVHAEPWKVTPLKSQPVSPSTTAFAIHDTSSHLNMERNATSLPARAPSPARGGGLSCRPIPLQPARGRRTITVFNRIEG
jgi:hypothetical protein